MNASSPQRMPALFIGHGSPMNVLEDNVYTRTWRKLGASLPQPKAIVAISAHWTTRGTAVTAMASPPTIHDFAGFPRALFEIDYPAPGDPALAARLRDMLGTAGVRLDESWGLDHGTWSVLAKMYPDADIPVVQLSIDVNAPDVRHFDIGRQLSPLRDEGVLILASGAVVHNLRAVRWNGGGPYDWAMRFNDAVRDCLLHRELDQLVQYARWGQDAALSVPTPEHFQPLLYIAGAKREDDPVSIPVDGIELGSISMLSAVIGRTDLLQA